MENKTGCLYACISNMMFGIVCCFLFVLCILGLVNYNQYISHATGEEALAFSHESGYYNSEFTLSITAADGCKIYYTTDGSVPVPGNSDTKEYNNGISITDLKGTTLNIASKVNNYTSSDKIDRAFIVRAISVDETAGTTSPVSTRTYFVGNDIAASYKGCAVMSLVTDPDNLLNDDTGIYVYGNNYYDNNSDIEYANFMQSGKEWERAANLEFFDGDNTVDISTGVGIRIHGGYTRREAQKSLNIYFRDEYDYGAKNLKGYELIPGATKTYYADKGNGEADAVKTKYSKVMIRNGGNEAGYGKYQDVFIQKMVEDRAFSTQSSRPCMVYINGEYWGIYNLTEKYSDSYLEEEYNVNKNNVIVYKNFEIDEGETLDADGSALAELEALGSLDMTIEANYEKFKNLVDIDSYIDYYATEIYINNNDWWSGCNEQTPRNNIQFWKVADPSIEDSANPYADGKWRYMLFDTEWSMGIYGSEEAAWNYDSLKNHAMGADNGYNGDPIFVALMKNRDFRARFTNTLLDLSNWNYEYNHGMSVLEQLKNDYVFYGQKHNERWTNDYGGNSVDAYNSYNRIKEFLQKRPAYVLTMLEDDITELSEADRVNVKVTANVEGDGLVKVNTITPDISSGWNGTYYKDYPITVNANPKEGYVFSNWLVSGCDIDDVYSSSANVTLTSSNAVIQAMYVKPGEDIEIINSTEKGYIVEYSIPFGQAKKVGDKIGFEVQINDCTSGSRYGTLNLFAKTSPYSSGAEFGTLILSDTSSTGNAADDSLTILKTNKVVRVDGLVDEAWTSAMPVELDSYQTDGGQRHCNATAKFLWDNSNLYVLVVVEDDDKAVNSNTYQSDSVEIFYDEDAANPVDYTSDMFQYRTLYNGTHEYGKCGDDSVNFNVTTAARNTGYIVEYEVPFANNKNAGDKVSLELQVINSISSYTEGRVSKLNLFATSSAFSDRSKFGLIELCDTYPTGNASINDTSAYALNTESDIKVDGIIDDEWFKAKPLDISIYTPKTINETTYEQDIWANARLMWNNDRLYVLVIVDDSDICIHDGVESDCVEVFFDEDVSESALSSVQYTASAFQHRTYANGVAEEGKNYAEAGCTVNSVSGSVGKLVTYIDVPEPAPSPVPTATPIIPTATPVPSEFTVLFEINPNVSIITYTTKDYATAVKADNQTKAYARNSLTGEIDVTGDGQVNFTIVPDADYEIVSVEVLPAGLFKNCKGSDETGLDNTYRITKIKGNLTVNIVTKYVGNGSEPTNTPKVTGTPNVTSRPKVTSTPNVTDEPKDTNTPNSTDAPKDTPKPTKTPYVTVTPSTTEQPGATNQPQPTASVTGTNGDSSSCIAESPVPDNTQKDIVLSKVKNLKVQKKGAGKVNVSWKNVKGASKYELSYSPNKNFKKAVKKVVIKKNKIIVKKLKRGKLYYFRVRALTKENNGKIYGSYSSKKKLKIS